MTVNVAAPDVPSLVAVTDVVPTASAVITPAADTDAVAGFAEVHVIVRPLSTLFVLSLSTAVAWVVLPSSTLVAARLTAIVATAGGITETLAVPCCPPLAAVIVADPTDTPVTVPVAVTVAMAGAAELHATGFVSAEPLAL